MEAETEATPAAAAAANSVDALKSSARELVDKASALTEQQQESSDGNHLINGNVENGGEKAAAVPVLNGNGHGSDEDDEVKSAKNGEEEHCEAQNGNVNHEFDVKEEEEDDAKEEMNKGEMKEISEDEVKEEVEVKKEEDAKEEEGKEEEGKEEEAKEIEAKEKKEEVKEKEEAKEKKVEVKEKEAKEKEAKEKEESNEKKEEVKEDEVKMETDQEVDKLLVNKVRISIGAHFDADSDYRI